MSRTLSKSVKLTVCQQTPTSRTESPFKRFTAHTTNNPVPAAYTEASLTTCGCVTPAVDLMLDTERNRPTDKQDTFQLNNTTIDLNKVVAFEEVLLPSDAPTEGATLVVHMADGSNTTIHCGGDSEAFAQAIDDHLGANLV